MPDSPYLHPVRDESDGVPPLKREFDKDDLLEGPYLVRREGLHHVLDRAVDALHDGDPLHQPFSTGEKGLSKVVGNEKTRQVRDDDKDDAGHARHIHLALEYLEEDIPQGGADEALDERYDEIDDIGGDDEGNKNEKPGNELLFQVPCHAHGVDILSSERRKVN